MSRRFSAPKLPMTHRPLPRVSVLVRPAPLALALLAVVAVSAQPEQGTLRIKVTLVDEAQVTRPVQRHRLLVSDNPPSAEPRQIITSADGTVVLMLLPGSYIVESDRPVVSGGRAYQWTQVVMIVAGKDLNLDLTAGNAEIVPLESVPSPTTASASREDPLLLSKYQDSVVAVWSPTARASGFVVDSRGLIATDGRAVGTAAIVEVQLAPTVKVPARVLLSERSRDVAIVWVDPSLVTTRPSLALACPPSPAPPLDDGQAIASITVPRVGETEVVHGEVTALQPRRIQTDVRLPFGGSGGPVFNDAGAVVGITSMPAEPDSRTDDAAVVPTVFICEALAASLPKLSKADPPAATQLPVEPTRPFPAGTLEDAGRGATPNAAVPVMSSADFDVAFVTPPMVQRAQQKSGWTGGQIDRSAEVQARLGRLTEFGVWSEYFSTQPAVLIVRVTPKMVEGFWKRLGREAAATQGAALPPFKDFKSSFRHMRAMCAGVEVTPVHPFVLEHHVSEKNVIREGLYVFDPGAFGPQCATVTLSLYSEAQPERADTLAPTRTIIDKIWNDFAPYRAIGR
jgi:S1-C subfamily serine protease